MTRRNVTRLDFDAIDVATLAWRFCQVLREPAVRKAWYKAVSAFVAEIEAVSQAISVTRAALHRLG